MNLTHQNLMDLSTTISMFVVILIFLVLFESRCSQRVYYPILCAFMVLWAGGNTWIILTYGLVVFGKYSLITGTLSSLLFFFLIAKNRGGRFFFTFCLVDTIMIWVMVSTNLIDFAVGSDGLVLFLLRMAAFPVMLLCAWRFARKPYLGLLHTVSRGWWLFAAMTGIFYITLILMSSLPTNIRLRPYDMPATVMLLILLPLTYITIFMVLRQQDILFRVRERQQTFEIQSAMMEQRASELHEAESRLRIERHDLRHRFLTIAAMVQQDNKEAVLDYIEAAQDALEETNMEHYCSNPLLDAVLCSYFRRAKSLGIQVETHLSLPEELPVPTAELTTVFANALENMIHAVQELPLQERRMVCKCISSPHLVLEFSNPCDPGTQIGPDGLPVSQGQNHGIGTRSIMAFAEKHQAICSFQVEDGWFTLLLAL